MGVVGSLMVPLLIGVQASVGATNKAQDHSIVGLILMIVYFFMAFAGRIRYLKLAGRKIGKKTDFCSLVLHKYGGFCIIGAAWWNCYTGLVRIGPEDSYVQAVVFSSIPLGYNLPVFGFIRKYLFFPYISCVCIIFALAEAKRRGLNGSSHIKKMQAILTGETSLWDDLPSEDIEEMTMETFLDLTRMGTALCIVDNYVLDITEFMENHPGGQHLLRYARGSDITEEVVGTRDVDGHRNVHSHAALQLMKTLVRAVLVDNKHKVESSFFAKEPPSNQGNESSQVGSSAMSRAPLSTKRSRHSAASVFRRARVVEIRNLTPEIEITHDCKPVILLRLAFPNTFSGKLKTCLPSFVFTFRGIDRAGVVVERQYTPILLDNGQLPPSVMEEDEIALDFIISLVPGGKMSKVFLDLRAGKLMLAQGPTVNTNTLKMFKQIEWESVVMIASGTGIAPNLQAIDFYLAMLDPKSPSYSPDKPIPRMYLLWLIRDPQYDYGEALGLARRMKNSRGKFHYTIVYSPKKESKVQSSSSVEKSDKETSLPYGSWSFKSLVDKVKPQILPERRQTVKRLVLHRSSKTNQSPSQKSLKLSSRRLFLGLEDEAETAPPAVVHGSDNKLTEKTWSGSIQHSTREYGKELLSELLESIPQKEEPEAAAEPSKMKSTYRPPRSSVSFATTTKEKVDSDDDDEDDASLGPEGLSPPHDLSVDAKDDDGDADDTALFGMSDLGMSKIMRLDHQVLVVISGAPLFEYKTLMALGELGVPKERTITFHSSSTRI